MGRHQLRRDQWRQTILQTDPRVALCSQRSPTGPGPEYQYFLASSLAPSYGWEQSVMRTGPKLTRQETGRVLRWVESHDLFDISSATSCCRFELGIGSIPSCETNQFRSETRAKPHGSKTILASFVPLANPRPGRGCPLRLRRCYYILPAVSICLDRGLEKLHQDNTTCSLWVAEADMWHG
jgi:hypothetical protein